MIAFLVGVVGGIAADRYFGDKITALYQKVKAKL
jgi:hypothetical protein